MLNNYGLQSENKTPEKCIEGAILRGSSGCSYGEKGTLPEKRCGGKEFNDIVRHLSVSSFF